MSDPKLPKYYQEIGAEVVGNQLLIRVEKNRTKKPNDWDPICDCKMPEIRRPTRTSGPKIVNVEDTEIIFKINSKSRISYEDIFGSEGAAYKIKNLKNSDKNIAVYPQLEGSGPQEIYEDQVTIGNENIYLMRIKKNSEGKEQKHRNIELQMNYPIIRNIPIVITPPATPPSPPTPPLESAVVHHVVPDDIPIGVNVVPIKKKKKVKTPGKRGRKRPRK